MTSESNLSKSLLVCETKGQYQSNTIHQMNLYTNANSIYTTDQNAKLAQTVIRQLSDRLPTYATSSSSQWQSQSRS